MHTRNRQADHRRVNASTPRTSTPHTRQLQRATLGRLAVTVIGLPAVIAAYMCDRAVSGGRDRGDVPGWVMITLMSAVLVMGLLAVAGPALEGLFNQAINRVSK
jgi:hypothetical protein